MKRPFRGAKLGLLTLLLGCGGVEDPMDLCFDPLIIDAVLVAPLPSTGETAYMSSEPADELVVEGLYFDRGDDLWLSVQVEIDEGELLLADLVTSATTNGLGRQLRVSGDGTLVDEAKTACAGEDVEASGSPPRGEWFRLVWHLRLGDENTGRSRVWIDDALVLEHAGRTMLPFAPYDRLTLGQPMGVRLDEVVVQIDPFAGYE